TLTASYLFRPGGTLSLVADWYPEAEWGAPSSPGSGLAAEVYPRLRLEQVLLRPAETLGLEPDRRRAEVARRRAELEWGQVRQEMDLTIRTAFFELLRAQDALQVAEHRLLRARQNAEAVRRQWQEGRRLAVDVAEAELEAERAALGVEEARHALAAARRKLADLTGLDPGEPWQPQRPDWAENEGAPRGAPSGERAVPGLGPADGSFAAPLASLQERAARSNLRLRLAALDVELAALEAEVAAQALRPDLRLVASYGKEWSSLSGESNSWSVGFSLRWEPALLPDPARANARLEAEAALRQARQAQEEARREVERQVEELYYAREEKARRVAVAAAAWRKARQALAVVSARAQEGLVGEVEVLQAEEALLQAEADYYAAVYEHHLARVRLAQAVGEVSPE
ncbi:MAG: TolC family protein, partial [Bacillota bacterium]|nr:TolC family protein [Bacillota bacterium]